MFSLFQQIIFAGIFVWSGWTVSIASDDGCFRRDPSLHVAIHLDPEHYVPSPSKNSEIIALRIRGTAATRPPHVAPGALPVALRGAQHVTISAGRLDPTGFPRLVLLKWVLRGSAMMGIGTERKGFGPGQVAVYLPNIPHRFWVLDAGTEMCWFTLDGPLAEDFTLQLGLHSGIYPSQAAPLATIMEMIATLEEQTPANMQRGSLLAIQTLYQVAEHAHTVDLPSVVLRAQHLIQQRFADPELSADAIASTLDYHRSALSRLFHRQAGVTLMNYLTRIRLQEAKALLVHTDAKVAEIAIKCGFRDTTYFCRWLRKNTGQTARGIRKSAYNLPQFAPEE